MAPVSTSQGENLRRAARRAPSKTPATAENGFFLEPDAWKELEESVIEPLVRESRPDEVIRVWVPQSGTGEDAYGIAMLLVERLDADRKRALPTVFATDEDGTAIEQARAGAYSAAVAARVSPERCASFLLERDGGQRYLIAGHLRATVIFGTHRLLDDPPFSRIDLICCPRGLRALRTSDRQRALEMFRSALRPGGHLFLAGSGLGELDAFLPVSRRFGIYQRLREDDSVSTPLTVCADSNFLIKWFAGSKGPLGPHASEIGCSLEDFAVSRGDSTLVEDAKTTLLKGSRMMREVQTAGGRWYERQTSIHHEGILVTYSDIESRKGTAAAMKRLTVELERRVDARTRNLRLLHETLVIANRAESFGQALHRSLDCIRHELGWAIAHAWLRSNESQSEAESDTLVDSGIWSLPSTTAFGRFIRASRQIGADELPWRAIRSGVACWVSDLMAAPGAIRPTRELMARGIRSALFVPIRVGRRIAGVLEFFTGDNNQPPKPVIDALEEIGGQLGRVLERDRSEKALHRMSSELLLAEERERGQLAADLHDDLGQLLALARMRIDGLLAQAPPECVVGLRRISDILGQANETARTVTFRLSPPILRELGLVPALEWLAENLPAPDGVRIRVSGGADASALSESARFILFRCTRELLMNAVRHAGASVIGVDVGRAAGSFTITVADDGKGFRSEHKGAGPHAGFGLFSVRERLGHLGGSLAFRSVPGAGTTATITLPDAPEER